jgi:hypothetical protein
VHLGDYLWGSVALLVGLLPWGPASRRIVRRLLPHWRGAEAALAAAIVGVSGVIVVAELLGIVDGLHRWVFAVVSAAAALAVSAAGVSPSPSARSVARSPRSRGEWAMLGCVFVCVVVTSMSLIGRDAAVLHTGPLDLDSLHYHLTQAAQMVQTHNVDHLHHLASSDGTVYYPFDSELLDAVTMFGPHPDLGVFIWNLLFGWLALLAGWVIGRQWSAGAPALAATAVVIALPIVSQASSGPGLNDLPTIALVLSALAGLAVAGHSRGEKTRRVWLAELSIAGAALGLAAGTKLNALPLVVLLALGVVVLARGDRWVATFALVGPAVLTGGFWYIRDWILVGSPVPDLNLTVGGHGFHVVPYPEVQPYAYTVAHYLGNGQVIRTWFEPGLHAVWTELWPLVGLLMLLGALVALFLDRSWPRRVVGAAVVIGFIAYVVTPTTAIGAKNAPVLFATNTRYVLPVLTIAMVLFASSPLLRRLAVPLTVGFTGLTIALISLSKLAQVIDYWTGLLVLAVVAVIVAGLHWVIRNDPGGSGGGWVRGIGCGIVVVGVVAAVAPIQHGYLKSRYVGDTPQDRLFSLVGAMHGQRIGVAGHGLEYPFYGVNFANKVNYVGISAPSHAFDGPQTCQALIGLLNRLHDDYLVVEPLPVEHTERIDRWTKAIPGVTEVYPGYLGHVYKLPATIAADSCSS